jgi:hypothetical protein
LGQRPSHNEEGERIADSKLGWASCACVEQAPSLKGRDVILGELQSETTPSVGVGIINQGCNGNSIVTGEFANEVFDVPMPVLL